MKYDWPGNVRELENIIQRSAVVAQGDVILAKNLPQEILDEVGSNDPVEQETPDVADSEVKETELIGSAPAENGATAPGANPGDMMDRLYQDIRGKADKDILQEIEREIIKRALKETGGNQVKTAAILGITRSTLRKRIEQFSLKF